jgi:hypothetical protein
VAHALQADAPIRISVDLVHADLMSLDWLTQELRRWLGLPLARPSKLSGLKPGSGGFNQP